MAKFWRSGMIDKKIVKEREQEEYINRLQRAILFLRNSDYGMEEQPKHKPCPCIEHVKGVPYIPVELSDKEIDDYRLAYHRRGIADKPLTPAQSAKKWGEGVRALFTGEYDEVRQGDKVILEFNKHVYEEPGEPIGKKLMDAHSCWLRKNATKRCDADIEFGRKIEELENESNTRTLRQEE